MSVIDEALAKKLLRSLHGLDVHLGVIDQVCSRMPDGPDRAALITAVGQLMHDITFEVMAPVYHIYPARGRPDSPGEWLVEKNDQQA